MIGKNLDPNLDIELLSIITCTDKFKHIIPLYMQIKDLAKFSFDATIQIRHFNLEAPFLILY